MRKTDYLAPEITLFELEIEDAILADGGSGTGESSFEDIIYGGELL